MSLKSMFSSAKDDAQAYAEQAAADAQAQAEEAIAQAQAQAQAEAQALQNKANAEIAQAKAYAEAQAAQLKAQAEEQARAAYEAGKNKVIKISSDAISRLVVPRVSSITQSLPVSAPAPVRSQQQIAPSVPAAEEPKKNNTLLYVGIGVAVLAVGFLVLRKK